MNPSSHSTTWSGGGAGSKAAGSNAPSAGSGRETLVAADGRVLAASWFEPPASQGPARAVAVVSSAAGVPRGYYRAFSSWMAARGYAVLTYDYRGVGGSRRGDSLARDPATMKDWAVLDMSAALAVAQARRASTGLPLLLVGHSFGANCITFARGVEAADALLAVASGLGEGRLYDGVHRALVEFFFRIATPAALAATGHLPGWVLGTGAQSLPAGVARQWSEWSRIPGWAYADPAMQPHRQAAALNVPVHVWNVADDRTYAPRRAVDALAAQFRNAAVQRHELHPADAGLRRLGHFGAFRREAGEAIWQRLLAPIEAATPALAGAGLRPPAPR